MAYPGYRYSRYSRSRFRPRRSYPLYRRRFTRSRRYRPRGYRTSPMYSAFRQIRNIQRQDEVKYLDVSAQTPIVFRGDPTAQTYHRISFTAGQINQGSAPDEMTGRRISLTSITLNATFTLLDSDNMPSFRIIAFLWKEGVPSSTMANLFNPVANLPQTYWIDSARFKKKTLLDRKFTMSIDRPVTQRTFRFKIPSRYITTPIDGAGGYNNVYFFVLSNSPSNDPYASMTYTARVSYKDA